MTSKINITKIVIAHLKTFRNLNQRRIDFEGIFLMLIAPLLICLVVINIENIQFNSPIADILTFVSITGGFLFNLLALIYSITEKVKSEKGAINVRLKYAKEIHSNIAFGILIAIILSILLLAYRFASPITIIPSISMITLFVIYYILGVFMLNLLLILKKIFILLDNQQ